jgi:hypothetical protein
MSQEKKLKNEHVKCACTADKSEYTIESLVRINESYNHEHGVSESDVKKTNDWVKHIEASRSSVIPKAGDRIIYTSQHGDYSSEAVIEKVDKNGLHVCIYPMIPFVSKTEAEDGIHLCVSGGPFTHIPVNSPKYIGKIKAGFKDWGHYGACGNGAVCFNAEVSRWEYGEQEPLYGNFTTRDWCRIYLYKLSDTQRLKSGYLYSGDGIAFRTEAEYQTFLKTTGATVFSGNWENQLVLWLSKK